MERYYYKLPAIKRVILVHQTWKKICQNFHDLGFRTYSHSLSKKALVANIWAVFVRPIFSPKFLGRYKNFGRDAFVWKRFCCCRRCFFTSDETQWLKMGK